MIGLALSKGMVEEVTKANALQGPHKNVEVEIKLIVPLLSILGTNMISIKSSYRE